MPCIDIVKYVRSHEATEDDVGKAFKLFDTSTMDAARSGINQQINITGEMANEIKVSSCGKKEPSYLYILVGDVKTKLFLCEKTASGNTDKEKNGDWSSVIREKTDRGFGSNGNERFNGTKLTSLLF